MSSSTLQLSNSLIWPQQLLQWEAPFWPPKHTDINSEGGLGTTKSPSQKKKNRQPLQENREEMGIEKKQLKLQLKLQNNWQVLPFFLCFTS